MFIYYALLLLGLVPLLRGHVTFTWYNKAYWYVLVPIILCFGYMTGSDWRNYELEWNLINVDNYNPFEDGYEEPGYWFLCYYAKKIGLGFWELNILIKLIGYYAFLRIYRFFDNNCAWGLSYALVFWMLNSLINFPARNFCAWICFFYGLKYIYERDWKKYIIVCALGLFFHKATIFSIPLYFLTYRMKEKSLKMSIWFIIPIVYLILVFRVQLLEYFSLLKFLDLDRRIGNYLESGTDNPYLQRTSFSVGLIIRSLVFVVATFYYKEITSRFKYGQFVLNMGLVVVLYDAIATFIPIIARAHGSILIMYCVLFSYLMQVVKVNRILIKGIVTAILLLYTTLTIQQGYIYVPYSNYLTYIFRDKPSYFYRDSYNKKHTPFKDLHQ